MFNKKTVKDVPLDGQRVLLRADYNVPLKNGQIVNDYRITQSLLTIQHLIGRGCQVVICSHLGRPEGKVSHELSLEPIAARLTELLGQPVRFITDCVGDKVRQAVKYLGPGQVLLLENLRFYPQEEENNEQFARRLASDTGSSYFIQDGFGVVHRAHASTSAIANFLPSVAGLLLEREVSSISGAIRNPQRPLVAVLGGAKVSDKIKVIEELINVADAMIIGGAMANTFLKFRGMPIGKSIHEEGQEAEIERIYRLALNGDHKNSINDRIILPSEVVVAKSLDEGAAARVALVQDVASDDYILDVVGQSFMAIDEKIKASKTVIWNGTLGMAEQPAYASGSKHLIELLANQADSTFSIIGGGDTVEFVLQWDAKKAQSLGIVSTGGGASLDLIAGEKLPGVEALMDK